jgi:type I restriction enzyme S subunit
MIHDLKPYSSMKHSGVPWLGEVPEHWEVRRNGRLFAERQETGFPELPILEVSLKTGVRVRDFEGSQRKQMMSDREQYKRACKGDIAYNMMRMWQGAVGVAPVDGLVSPAYVVARPLSHTVGDYFAYLFRTGEYMGEVNHRSRGIVPDRNRLYWEDFKQIPTPYPPSAEQAAVVRFLDHADRRIRRCIRAKQKLIALLEEQKQAIIHRAVTRGLDPHVRLKPSGVEWLGDVPEHWEVVALRLRYSVQLGKMLDGKRITGDHLVPYLRNTDVQWDRINTEELPRMDIRPEEYGRYTLATGDLLVCEGGEVGRAALWKESEAVYGYQKALHRLRPIQPNRDVPRFLYFVLCDAAKRGVFLADGSENTIAHLTAEKLRRYRVPFPPTAEQAAIARSLDEALIAANRSLDHAGREISLLREYRTRLIADVVTGKLDVRAAAASLPEERDEPEALQEVEGLAEGEDAEAVLDAASEEAEE